MFFNKEGTFVTLFFKHYFSFKYTCTLAHSLESVIIANLRQLLLRNMKHDLQLAIYLKNSETKQQQ